MDHAERVMTGRLPELDIRGVGRSAGSTYGEGVRDMIQSHLEEVYQSNSKLIRLGREQLVARTAGFRSAVAERYPLLAEEIDGIADGAGIEVEEAWLLQLRSEVQRVDSADHSLECTAIGAMSPATRSGEVLAGQNGDLPGLYEGRLVVVRRSGSQHLRTISVTPAGQISWHGMNEAGMAAFGNFLNTDGWRVGIPRYLYTRLALEERTVPEAIERLNSEHRSSSRNLLLADPNEVADLELGVLESSVLSPSDGVLAHTNHFLSHMADQDTAPPAYAENSQGRLDGVGSLLEGMRGMIDLASFKTILMDRTSPHFISIAATDPLINDLRTVVSTIAEVGEGRLWIAPGPPHLSPHIRYDL